MNSEMAYFPLPDGFDGLVIFKVVERTITLLGRLLSASSLCPEFTSGDMQMTRLGEKS